MQEATSRDSRVKHDSSVRNEITRNTHRIAYIADPLSSSFLDSHILLLLSRQRATLLGRVWSQHSNERTNFGHLFNVTIALAIAVAVATSSTSGENSESKTPADVGFDKNSIGNLFAKTLAACGMHIYDSSTHMCCAKIIMPRPSPHTECCGNLRYDNRYYKCCGTTLRFGEDQDCCGTEQTTYTTTTHLCCRGRVIKKPTPDSYCCPRGVCEAVLTK
ncbi:hypothetical protein LSAT2_010083 [Lamellibrachia satsuma]|nr:hypothetical protein LSAT2_010083 [Lamellibrachia satsuma]